MVEAGNAAVSRAKMHDRKMGTGFPEKNHAPHKRDELVIRCKPNRIMVRSGGSIMRRVIAIAITGLGLAGCSSFSMDYFRPTPATMQIQLESTPPGADARTSLGPGCKTPCAVTVPAPEAGFSVSYTLNKFQPVTVPVQVSGSPGNLLTSSTMKIDPNPVVAELRPIGPPPKPERKPMRPKKPKKPAAAPADAGSPFPDPGQAPPPPSSPNR
jgi:hypothetical protein